MLEKYCHLMNDRYDDCGRENAIAHKDTYVVGTGVGLLAAAAVASSPSLSSLIPIAIEVVLISFRLGSRILATATKLALASSPNDCWASVVTGYTKHDISEILSSFHSEKVCLTRLKLVFVLMIKLRKYQSQERPISAPPILS